MRFTVSFFFLFANPFILCGVIKAQLTPRQSVPLQPASQQPALRHPTSQQPSRPRHGPRQDALQPTAHPNVVIILADDMGYGDVSAFNPGARTRTPAIDEMTRQSAVFTDAHSGGAVCTPSRYGLMTGRYYFRLPPHKEYLGYLRPLIEENRETIGGLMQKAGYTTACIGKWHLGLDWGLTSQDLPQIPDSGDKRITNTDFEKPVGGGPNARGFDYSFLLPASLDMPPYVFVKNGRVTDPRTILTADVYPRSKMQTAESGEVSSPAIAKTNALTVWDRKYTNSDDIYWERGVWWRNGEMSVSFKMEDCFDTLVNQGLSYIRDQAQNNPEKPFMLYLALTGPHTPWMPDKQYKGATALGIYGDFVLQVDQVVKKINDTLKALKIADNTMVIFASDNGAPWTVDDIQTYAHQANQGRRGQKGDCWDGGHHIPLIVKWPAGIKRKRTLSTTVSLIDLMATFSAMTGQPIATGYGEDSFNCFPLLMGRPGAAARDHIIYISSSGRLAIKKANWKLIDGLGSGGFTDPSLLQPVKGGPAGQLYNLAEDPLEANNLYLRYPGKVRELSGLLEKIKKQGYSFLPSCKHISAPQVLSEQ